MEEKKTKNKLVKISDIIVIIIGIVILIFGLNYVQKENRNSSSSLIVTREEQEEEKVQSTIIIVGFAITAFGMACIIKRVLDKKDTKSEKSDNSTSAKIKELQKMLDYKIITAEEYEQKKQELLKKM